MPKSKRYIDSSESESGSEDEKPKKKPKSEKKLAAKSTAGGSGEADDMFDLTRMKFAKVSEFKGKKYVNIREYYEQNGELKPGKKGIALNEEQWRELKKNVDDIDAALEDL